MARLDPNQLSDRPITPTATEPTDPRGTDWYRFVQDIEDLLATGQYTFAEDTLRGVQRSVEASQRVTDGQRRAVRNIEDSKNRPTRGGSFSRRRYEGYGR